MAKPFHLAWFTNFTQGDWTNPVSVGTGNWDGKFFVEFAQAMLKYALQVPKHDPMPLAAMISAATSKLGVVATMSTLAYPPFMLARLSSTLDHICGGRFGWNIVTSGEDTAAQNFGLDKLPPRETRYAMADEYVDLVCKLFDSWEPDAVVMDAASGTYADHTKVHPIN